MVLQILILVPLLLVSSNGQYWPPYMNSYASSSSSVGAPSSYYSNANRNVYPWQTPPQPPPPPPSPPPQFFRCRANEVFVSCPIAVCAPKTCDDVGQSVPCPDLPRNGRCPVSPGCICREGFVRGPGGVCIPISRCPSKCKLNEVYDVCPSPCPFRTCGINDAAVSCAPALPQGHPDCPPPRCRCKDGYYRNDIGQCVRWEDCPKCTGIGEIYDPCPAPCPPQRCDVDPAVILCGISPTLGDPECRPGCRCIDNFVRNYTGQCIPRELCPVCPSNEVFDPCIASCPPRTCDVDDRLIRCPKPPELGDSRCTAGCRCADGFVRNSAGVCVTREQCPLNCYENEYYNECANAVCGPQSCDELGYPQPCSEVTPEDCVGECLCLNGYVRDKQGICVPTSECPSCGGDVNAVSGCGVHCNDKCSDIGKPPGPCILICYANSCDCKDGFYFDVETKKCVSPNECPKVVCGQNEVFNNCTSVNCGPKYCAELGYPLTECLEETTCVPGCTCSPGYLRNDDGICVPTETCPSCGGDPNAVPGCGINCNKRCSDIGKPPGACITLCRLNACDCKDGYYLDENTNRCVLPEECSPTCPLNEYFSNCTNANCNPETCSQVGYPIACPRINPEYCEKGCLCKQGFARNCNGICVPINQCPSCGGDPNAEGGGSGTNCGKLCSNYNKGPVSCPLVEAINGCDCRDGFVYDSNIGKCVLPQDCTPVCSENEVYSECINGGCGFKNCSQLGTPAPCVKLDSKYCIKGCLCKNGYLRADNGFCVPERECNPECFGLNEVYDPCPPDCPPQTCESLDRAYACPVIPKDTDDCKGSCRCESGFYRNKIGDCISEADCLKCMGPHEYYSCGGACDNVCATLTEQNQTHCPIVNIACNKMCYCEEGFARANNNTCIPIDKCNEFQCPVNEIYDPCPATLDMPQSCDQLGYRIEAPTEDLEVCPSGPGCVCKEGYVRNEYGICIPVADCPSCGGDPNAVSGSGVNCKKRCEDLGKEDVSCLKIYYVNSCDCRDGFYYDSKKNKCVPPEQCNVVCGENERFEKCPRGLCGPQRCDELGVPLSCEDVEDGYCPEEPGCVCNDGYVRNDKGVCIPVRQCPSCGNDENAQSGCGVNCGTHCDDVFNITRPCRRICFPNSCDCRNGFYFDEIKGKCVTADQCSARSASPGAVNETTALANYQKGVDALTSELIYQLIESRPGESFIVSATSLLIALAQIALYAVGVTLEQLLRILNLKSQDEIRTVFPILLKNYQEQQQVIFKLAIKYYGNKDVPFTDNFKQESKAIFGSEGENLDFSDNVNAARIINEYIAQQTNNLIKNLISPDSLNAGTRSLLLNALYFMGNWKHQFNPNNTMVRDFFTSETHTISIPTMFQQRQFMYGESNELDCQILSLPYKGDNFTFTIYLPKTKTGLRDMVLKLRNPQNFANSQKFLQMETVRAYIPLMDITTDVSNLKEILMKANLTAPFDPKSDGIKGIVKNNEPLYISEVIQKGRMKLDETGTEAAVATAIQISTTSAVINQPKIYTFEMNRPCLFFLSLNGGILMNGVFTGK